MMLAKPKIHIVISSYQHMKEVDKIFLIIRIDDLIGYEKSKQIVHSSKNSHEFQISFSIDMKF